MQANSSIDVYTDGSSLNNPGKGGWAAIILRNGKVEEHFGGYRKTTNNRMEYLAAINALKELEGFSGVINLHTDSELLINTMTKWIFSWQKKGWKKSDGKPVLNLDLVMQIFELSRKLKINWIKVAAHTGNHYNEMCDQLAKAAAEKAYEIDHLYENPNAKPISPIPTAKTVKAPSKKTQPSGDGFDLFSSSANSQKIKKELLSNDTSKLFIEKNENIYSLNIYDRTNSKLLSSFEVKDINELCQNILGAKNG